MSCSRIENKILPYVDGRLKASEVREVETHIAACAVCRLRVNEFHSVAGLLDELPQIEPSPAFDARVRARVAALPARRSWWAWFAPSPRVAFAASMLLLATVWISTRNPGTPTMNEAAQYEMIKDLPVLEDYDVLANFEPLTDLPSQQTQNAVPVDQQTQSE
jgi:anti-sigma factor RsiW